MTMRGTPMTSKRSASSGNSIDSTISACTPRAASAIWCAVETAGAQYGQVGVTNTRMRSGRRSPASRSCSAGGSSERPLDTPRMAASSAANS